MATVEFECPNPDCHQMLNVPEAHVGRPARCPMCKTVVRVRPAAGPGRHKLSPLEEQVGQWIGATADEMDEIPDPESIREARLRSEEPEAEPEAESESEATGVVGSPAASESAGRTAMRCPHCKHPVGRGQDICPYCGRFRGPADKKAGKKLQRNVRVADKLRRMREGSGGSSAFGGRAGGVAAAAGSLLVCLLAAGVGALAFLFPAGREGGIPGEWLAVIALVVIGAAGGIVATKVSIRGRPRPMTPFILLIVAGWVYQVVITAQMLAGWSEVYPHLATVPRALGFAYLGTQAGIGFACLMIMRMKRMSLAVLAVFVLAGIVLLAIMRGTGGDIGHIPPLAYVDLGRLLIGTVGLWKYSDMMTE